jgi:hypothetical protein
LVLAVVHAQHFQATACSLQLRLCLPNNCDNTDLLNAWLSVCMRIAACQSAIWTPSVAY